jgi:NAD(P)-dependent dehydrogenase (short-subunit alcohol dehydrogenase family)
MASVLISGASRGLGLEFARQYTAAGWRVYATCRRPAQADELNRLDGDISVHALDVARKDDVETLARSFDGRPLDVVIANAGVYGDHGMAPEAIDRPAWDEVVAVNTFGALALATAFKRHLLAGGTKKLVAISSLMASIARNDAGGQYVYRASKAALNALWRSLAVDWRALGLICLVVRPGFVRTAFTGYRGDLDPPESVGGMRAVIDRATIDDSGRFLSYDGEEIPW